MATPAQLPSGGELHAHFGELYRALNDAYWKASTTEDRDRIRGCADCVHSILTRLDEADLRENTVKLKALDEELNLAVGELNKLKADIARVIRAVERAAQVTAAIDKAVGAAGQYLGTK